jgi:predicted CXXCH cytochrome family protein
VACHSPHQSSLDKLLLAKTPDLCLNCHKTMKTRMDGARVHPPAARDCLRCHKPHASAESRLLAQPVRGLCSDCHDVRAPKFGQAHLDIDPAIMRCERCHDPHASKDQHFFKSEVHPPFAMKSCSDCHLAARAQGK